MHYLVVNIAISFLSMLIVRFRN